MNRIPRMCLHKRSGRAYVTDPATGTEVPLGIYGTPEAEAAYAEWVRLFLQRRPGEPAPKGPTVGEVLDAFWEHSQTYYVKGGRPTSELWFIKALIRLLASRYGRRPATNFGRTEVVELRENFEKEGKLLRKTANKKLRMIGQIWHWAADRGMVPAAAWHEIKAVKPLAQGRTPLKESPGVPPVPWAHVEAVLPLLPDDLRTLTLLCWHTGMRPGEAVALTAAELDLSAEPWVYRPGGHKTAHHGKDRLVYLGPKAREVLTPFLAGGSGGWLFPSSRKDGRHRSVHSWEEILKDRCPKAGVPVWMPNQLRHARLTEVRRVAGLEAAQVIGGHARADVSEIYAERDATLAMRVAEESG
jgi:integrase